jgi:hypothetical protein
MEGKKSIPVLVASPKPWWLEAFRALLSIGAASLITVLWYQLVMSKVFPGLVSANLMPATLTFEQAGILIIGLWALLKGVSWLDGLF